MGKALHELAKIMIDPTYKIASYLPEPQGTGLAIDGALGVRCPREDVSWKRCLAWAYENGNKPCQHYKGLCRLAHPETGSEDPERYTVGVDCLFKTAKAVSREN